MDGVDVRRSDRRQTQAADCVNGEEERQTLLDSAAKSEHMKSQSSMSPVSSDASQLDGTKLAKPVNAERNTLSAGLLKVLDATRPSIGVGSHTPSQIDPGIDKAPGDGSPSPAAEAGDPEASTPPDAEQTPQGEDAEKPEGYDPNRIPSSVFRAKKSFSSIDWSLASNESLFSIRMESCRFSRELVGRSGELGRFSYSPPPATDASEMPLHLSVDPEEARPGIEPVQDAATEEVNAQTMVDVLRAAAGEHGGASSLPPQEEGVLSSASNQCQSDASSVHSFAFPILTRANVSLKVVPEQQPVWQKNTGSKRIRDHPKTLQCRWFHCFSCSLCRAD